MGAAERGDWPRAEGIMTIMADSLHDAEPDQMEQRVLRALGAVPPPWMPETETRATIGGCNFIRFGDDPAADQEMYPDVQNGQGQLISPDAHLYQIIEFVARAPEDIVRLIAEVRRLRG
jgi:hypothetical protein